MNSILTVGLSVLFLMAVAVLVIYRGFKKPSGCGCSCAGDTKKDSVSCCGGKK